MPHISGDLVATILVALTIFFILRMIVMGVYGLIIEYLREVKRIKAIKGEHRLETERTIKVVK